ncbi:MAG TPA: hypothetical protein VIK58_13550, partial [Caldimonas sp.]
MAAAGGYRQSPAIEQCLAGAGLYSGVPGIVSWKSVLRKSSRMTVCANGTSIVTDLESKSLCV